MKKNVFTILLISSVLCLSACGNRKNDNISSDLARLHKTDTLNYDETESIPFSNYPDWKMDVTYNTDGSNRAKIYSATEIEFSDEYLKKFATNIFDKGSMKVCKPYQICNKNELESAIYELDEINSSNEENKQVPLDYYNIPTNALSMYNEDNVHELAEGACIVEYNTDYGCAYTGLLNGKINGTDYAIIYTDTNLDTNSNEQIIELIKRKNPAPIRIQRLSPSYEYRTTYDINYSGLDALYGENLVSETEARKLAEQFILDIGFDDFVIDDFGKRACVTNKNTGTGCYDGYTYMFTRQIDGINCPIFSNNEIVDTSTSDHDHNKPADTVGYEEFLRVDVDCDGIALADLYVYYEIGETISSGFNIISYNKATNLIPLDNYSYLDHSSTIKLDACFTYIPYKYDNKNVFLPVWVFYSPKETMYANYTNVNNTSDNLIKRNIFLVAISALDGSLIDYTGLEIYETMFQEIN